MAEPALPSKRKSDSDLQDLPTKTPKVKQPSPDANDNTSPLPNSESVNDDKPLQNDDKLVNDDEDRNEDVHNDDEDDDDEDDEDGDDEEVEDRKGKGVMRDDKGKGKMIEEDDDDDDDNSDDDSDGDDGSDDDSDFSDDPLAEVDLENILPSRTRRRTAGAGGVHITDDVGNAAAAADVGGNDSDDSDA